MSIPVDTPYNSPPFELLDLSRIGKLPPYNSKPAAFVLGIEPLLDEKGNISALAISGSSELIPVGGFEDIAESLCSEEGDLFIYATYYRIALDCMLKTLPLLALKTLQEEGTVQYRNFRIWYTPNHLLTIRKGKETARIQTLENWSTRAGYLGALRRAKIPFRENELISLATATKQLGTLLKEKAEDLLDREWGNISSPSSITKYLLASDLRKTDIQEIPLEAIKMAYECLHSPWVEILGQGFFPKTWDYDLNSAYPTEIASLTNCDPRIGDWFQSGDYQGRATYGFCLALIDLLPSPGGVSPIKYRKSTGRLFSPYGTWVSYITKAEIDFIRKWKLGKVEILGGWWFIPSVITYPFKKTVETLIRLRRTKDQVMASLLKITANRINGNFLQKYERPDGSWIAGPLFNPIYATEVMTRTKLRLAEMAFEVVRNGGQVLSTTVDGLTGTATLGKNPTYKLVAQSPALIVAPFVMWIEDRLTKLKLLNTLWSDPNRTKYSFSDPRRLNLCEGIQLRSPERIGERSREAPNVRVGGDTTRIWTDIPLTGKDLLTRSYLGKQPPIEWVEMPGSGQKERQEYA